MILSITDYSYVCFQQLTISNNVQNGTLFPPRTQSCSRRAACTSTLFSCILGGVKKCSILDKVQECKLLKTGLVLIDILQNGNFPQAKKSEDTAKGRTQNQ